MKRLAFLLVLPLLLASCGDGDPAPSTSPIAPSSTTVPSPTLTVSATPSDEQLYAEAERVRAAAAQIRARYEAHGEFNGFPEEELAQYMFPEYLDLARELYDFMAAKQWRAAEGAEPIITSAPAPGRVLGSSEIVLHVCKDTRPAPLLDANGNVMSDGVLYESYLGFAHDTDGRLKISGEQYREVESCEA